MQYVSHAGVISSLGFLPLVLLGSKFSYFRNGVLIAAVSKKKRTDILAAGGRYDHLIKKMEREIRVDPVCAYAMQIDVEVIKEAVAKFQHDSLKALTRDERSYGIWSPRRCDVYVVPQQDGCTLEERMEVVSYLWENNISADVMYETSLQATEYVQVCKNEGILYVIPTSSYLLRSLKIFSRFLLYVKARTAKREQPSFRVKSLLKHEEAECKLQSPDLILLMAAHYILISISPRTYTLASSRDNRAGTFGQRYRRNPGCSGCILRSQQYEAAHGQCYSSFARRGDVQKAPQAD